MSSDRPRPSSTALRRRLVGLAAAAASACVTDGTPPPTTDPGAEAPLTRLVAVRGREPGLFDASGRQVLLRGVNLNHLGDYFEADPTLPTVAELGADDWRDVAATGASVVRLVTSWSAWQPERGAFDETYLGRVRDAIDAANRHGLYVVVDMHQDAWSKHVFTPRGEACPEGTRPQIGWDGAPAWATFTDGAPTCTPGGREASPAVVRAWDAFYANREGVRDALAQLWGRIAGELAAEDGVAGFDLLNEPGHGTDLAATQAGLTAYYRSAIEAIRAAETATGASGHVLFFETTVFGVPADFRLSDDPNLVFAPHNYFESIIAGPEGLLDFSFDLFATAAALYGTTVWTGEYGSFSSAERNDAWMERYAALEDERPGAGGTWWQWEQECGDPHDVSGAWPPSEEWVAEQRLRCGDARFRISPCARRAFVRAAPGRLTSLAAPGCGATLAVTGETDARSTADLWVPSDVDVPPIVTGTGVLDVAPRRVGGGWRIAVAVEGRYEIAVAP